jgi:hypothetical protein
MGIDKLSLYEKRLLDLGKRNRLLNFHYYRLGALELLCPSAPSLYNKLVSSSSPIKVIDVTAKDDGSLPNREELLGKYANKLTSNQVLLYRSDFPSRPIVRSLSHKAASSLEEKGTNILYFAFAFLSYKDPETKELLKAPLLLVPVLLEGGGPAQPYFIHASEDEAELNPTFAYYCKSVYKLDLPAFTPEVDYESYLKSIADLVAPLGWSLDSSSAALSTFSFQKMSMYLDLKNNHETIVANPVVNRLLGGAPLPAIPSDGKPLNEVAFHNVCLADSSQLYAIKMAKDGLSFVLQGPPGTGKSQTITNIIAESLYEGKKVLFVSEKLAALQVVYGNLKKVGLEPYCLELHSDKTDKKRVFLDLAKTLEMKTEKPNQEAEDDIVSLVKSRVSLDEYASAIHAPTDFGGLSFYELVARLLSLSDTDPSGYLVPAINNKDKKFLDEAVELLGKYDSFAKRFGYDYRKSPIADFDPRPYSYELQDALTKKTPIGEETLSSLPKTEEKLAALLGKAPTSLEGHEDYESFVKALAALSFEPQSLFAKATRDAVRKNLLALEAEQNRLASEAHALDGEINLVEDVASLTNLVNEEKKGYGVFFLFNKKFKTNGERLKKVVLIKGGREEKLHLLERELTYLRDVTSFKKSLKDNLAPFDKSYDEGLGTSFSKMIALIDYFESGSKKGYFLNACKPVYEKLDFRANLKKAASEYSGKTKKLVACYKALQPSFTGSKKNLAKLDYGEVLTILKGLEPYFVDAREVSLYRDWLDKARNKGLLDFLNKSLSASLPSEALPRIYEKDFLVEEIHLQIAKSPLLSKFSRAEHEKLIAKFSALDEEQYKISTLMISERVGSRRPDPNNQSGASPVGMIMREAQKSTRLMPTRYLLQHYFSTVSNIKPVFLMSPLSVATYLLPEAQFDLVVFDEASQIYPEDALGAIYRAKQAIIVGDSRQLPPTSFFVATEDETEVSDEDYEEDDSSLESILDLAAAYLPPERLLWHYRSKNEELIAFSNKEFYNSSLYSFPAASKKAEDGIHLHYLADGVYEAGKRTNEKEASYIADLVYKLGHEYPGRSIGVVAFSEAQMNLIDDKVETRRLSDKSLDATLFARKDEPFFVKNLETVQGDERDIMIISVCYGKDKDGRFYQRFGPLNNEGGERRLNVAITRAKYALELVTSIHGSDIDTSKTASEGARQLKNYLDFAANPVAAKTTSEDDDAIAKSLAAFLKEQGYTVDEGFGFSHGSVQLAIRKGDSLDHDWAIETDGTLYKDAKNARDREELRPFVLHNMGWKYLRVYSECFAENPDAEKALVLKALRSGNDNNPGAPSGGEKEDDSESDEPHEETNLSTTVLDPKQGLSTSRYKPYLKSAALAEPYLSTRGGRYFLSCTEQVLKGTLYADILMEGPVSALTLYRRLACLGDEATAPARGAAVIKNLLGQCAFADVVEDEGFYYVNTKEDPFAFRTVDPSSGVPLPIEDIHLKEIQDGMEKELWRNGPMERDALYKNLSLLLGYKKVSETQKARFEMALKNDQKLHAPSSIVTLIEN